MWTSEDKTTTQPLLQGDSSKKNQRFQSLHNTSSSRSCNDLLFVLVFISCLVCMSIISAIAYSRGNPSLLIPSYLSKSTTPFEGWFQNAVAQCKLDSDVLVGSIGIAVVLGFVWIYLMKMFTKLFIYISIVGYILFGLSLLLVLLVILLRKKIALTCAMFTETCRGVEHNLALFPVSFAVVALFLGFCAYWVSSFIYLYSIPGESIDPNSSTPPKFNERIRNLMFFMVFGFLWTSAFLSAVFQHTVAGAIATWYFSRDVTSPRPTGIPALTSLFTAITTSFGSLAFGSLIIAVVESLNTLLQHVKRTNSKNKLVVFVASCLQCVLGCIEGIVRYVNKFAYIYVAMHGYSFCKGAKECFDLISRNFFTTVIMDVISGFVLFMGKVLFTAITTIITMIIIDQLGRQLSIVTVGLTAVISFIVLHIISHVIGVGINAVFVCYLEDLEHSHGKSSEMYISPDLHSILQKKVEEEKGKSSQV